MVIMFTTILAKVLGLVRNRLLFHYFSTNSTDILFAASQIPDLIFNLTILGALSVAFIPVFIEYRENKSTKEAFEMSRAILTTSLLIFIVLAALIFIFAQPLTRITFPGFDQFKSLAVVDLTRIILIGEVILIFGSFFVGILQSSQRFIIPALAPAFYNLGIITGTILLSGPLGIEGPAIGVIIGALLHMAIQYPIVRSMGFRFFPIRLRHPGVGEIIHLMGWRSIGLAAEQINDKFSVSLASLLASGSVSVLTVAQQLQVVPISLFGAALAQAAMPILSSEKARGQMEEFKATLLNTIHQILFLCLPATAILIVIRIPVVRLVFGARYFVWQDTVLAGMTLAFLSIGLASQATVLLLVRGFYALRDTKTPVTISIITVILNLSLCLYFIKILNWGVWSIGLANSFTGILSVICLFILLHLKVGKFRWQEVLEPFLKMFMATIIMGIALYIPIKLLDQVIFDTTRTFNLLVLTGLSSLFALLIYILLVWYLEVKELTTFVSLGKSFLSKFGNLSSNMKSEEIINEPGGV